jgi:hypothetical protein
MMVQQFAPIRIFYFPQSQTFSIFLSKRQHKSQTSHMQQPSAGGNGNPSWPHPQTQTLISANNRVTLMFSEDQRTAGGGVGQISVCLTCGVDYRAFVAGASFCFNNQPHQFSCPVIIPQPQPLPNHQFQAVQYVPVAFVQPTMEPQIDPSPQKFVYSQQAPQFVPFAGGPPPPVVASAPPVSFQLFLDRKMDLNARMDFIRNHYLHAAMKGLLRQCIDYKVFDDPMNRLFSPDAKQRIPLGLILPAMGLMNPAIATQRFGYLDVDEVLLMHNKDVALSQDTHASRRLQKKLDPLIRDMELVTEQISSFRPLIYNEHFSRLFLFKAGHKLMQVEFYLSSKDVLKSDTKRKNLPDDALKIMQNWFGEHKDHPYPTAAEKQSFAEQGGITLSQVEYWFVNARSRSNIGQQKQQSRKN